MSRRMLVLASLLSISALAACTSGTDQQNAPAAAQSGGACAADLSEFTGIIEKDHATGDLAERVYKKMKPELIRADAACRAGNNAEALKMLAATRGRYGYR